MCNSQILENQEIEERDVNVKHCIFKDGLTGTAPKSDLEHMRGIYAFLKGFSRLFNLTFSFQLSNTSFEAHLSYRNGVGTAGSLMTMYYAEVTDTMKAASGGGNSEEGELIDVVEIPASEGKAFMLDESKNKPVAMVFGMQWFYENVYSQGKTSGKGPVWTLRGPPPLFPI